MKLTQLQPRYVLIIPSSDDAYTEMVKEMNQEDAEIGWSEYQEFKQVNRENPGYFDMVIPADTVEQAHIAVRDLVKDFLGGQPSTPSIMSRKDSRATSMACSSRQRRAEILFRIGSTSIKSYSSSNKIRSRISTFE